MKKSKLKRETVVRLSKIKLLLLVGAGMLQSALGLGLVFAPETPTLYPALFIKSLGWLNLVMAVAGLVRISIMLLDRRPGLVLNHKGFLAPQQSLGRFIPWRVVASIHEVQFKWFRWVVVQVKDSERRFSMLPWYRRLFYQWYAVRYGGAIILSAYALATSQKDLYTMMRSYWEHFGTGSQP